ncbi:hypothetical protein MIND_00984700 [Mycena indigotica]|uniref:Uncharacterized protein n=1 Tax=Mycena indigotica TaxID=2126181 RepID=A0A8H6SDK8_9AGAR|nr:uncharacterized protein MIND_00984700 [Mycena indigotica]KAF7297508.1 hypothetical protein MIND_00984700 [Mycena indigotica]
MSSQHVLRAAHPSVQLFSHDVFSLTVTTIACSFPSVRRLLVRVSRQSASLANPRRAQVHAACTQRYVALSFFVPVRPHSAGDCAPAPRPASGQPYRRSGSPLRRCGCTQHSNCSRRKTRMAAQAAMRMVNGKVTTTDGKGNAGAFRLQLAGCGHTSRPLALKRTMPGLQTAEKVTGLGKYRPGPAHPTARSFRAEFTASKTCTLYLHGFPARAHAAVHGDSTVHAPRRDALEEVEAVARCLVR